MADKKQAQEAIARINTLVRQCGLNPKIAKYSNEGKIYYSYLTAGGLMGSIDTITYDPKYAEAVRQFESLFRGSKVYHAIETKTGFGTMLSLLYVSANARASAHPRPPHRQPRKDCRRDRRQTHSRGPPRAAGIRDCAQHCVGGARCRRAE